MRPSWARTGHGLARIVGGALFGAILAVVSTIGAAAQEARLGPLQTLRLTVLSWSAVDETVRDWPALTGDYRTDGDGLLTIPFLDPIPVTGRDAVAVAGTIADRLRERFALSDAPVATVMPVDLPTVVVGGLVRTPGTVAFRPGLTVRHALALAGGIEIELGSGRSILRDQIVDAGQARVLEERRRRQLALLARLEAERDGNAPIVRPVALDGPRGDAPMEEQAAILAQRRARTASDLDALAEQIDLYRAEVRSLEAKVTGSERQRDLARETLEDARSLAERGLARNDRLVGAERSLIEAEIRLLDTSTAILRARQAISVASRESATLVAARIADVVQQIVEASGDLAEIEERLGATRALLSADAVGRVALAAGPGGDLYPVEPVYTIYRAGAVEEPVVAMPDTPLRSGDLLTVALPDDATLAGMVPADGLPGATALID